jgi:hypothetical protein
MNWNDEMEYRYSRHSIARGKPCLKRRIYKGRKSFIEQEHVHGKAFHLTRDPHVIRFGNVEIYARTFSFVLHTRLENALAMSDCCFDACYALHDGARA